MISDYTKYDALGLAELVRKKEVSPKELLDCAIERANLVNPDLNAIIHRFDELAYKQVGSGISQGCFYGVPFLLKDLHLPLRGTRYTMGSRAVNEISPYDSHLVERFKDTGVSIFGKTNTPEFGLIITTEPKAHGVTHNPFKHGYSTGGSSGGSAAAVAAGIVPMAGGGDGGGSIRFPSAWCGIFGFKPSRGRNPVGPDYGEVWNGAVIDHVLTRSVRDSAAMLDATHGPELGGRYQLPAPNGSFYASALKDPKPLTIALSQRPLIDGTQLDEDVSSALYKTADQLKALGHTVIEAEPDLNFELAWKHFFIITCAYTAATVEDVKNKYGRSAVAKLEPSTQSIAAIGRSLRAHDVIAAEQGWHKMQQSMECFLRAYDVMLCPTVPTPAVPHGTLPAKPYEEMMMHIMKHLPMGRLLVETGAIKAMSSKVLQKMAFAILGNMTGLPCMSVPLHFSKEGLPIGMQFVGRMADEQTLFSLAGQLERAELFTPLACELNK